MARQPRSDRATCDLPPTGGCSASSRPPPRHPSLQKTTVTVTSGSPASHWPIAPCAARAIWSALKARCLATRLASCRGRHLTRAMCTGRHRHYPRARWSSPCGQREPTRALASSHHHRAAKLRIPYQLTSAFPLSSRDGPGQPPGSGARHPCAGHHKSPPRSFNAHKRQRLRSGLAQTFF
ncbi:hypothetical protein B0G74_9084 [Paraburkholderia sp. BL9I2N2]|nr:hypothetical protein B0G74_9084 [Paraburkholderia sp. BL9I2N2]